ncbi:uncharacterized protein SPAPADRAFT_62490 [Spathaspora passalidarum NRRL Y-27907]|uniref:Uncharacterized protein n=1 Tax=Spathaspora passalidarum (strain NRRL Y-27907 / 11-Y1) TaxID=619300 RepID=G3AS36_SPAPN|nr:uncharacterized protein SPAPADRAFT_62490 [Spathaspora passalidarum NRRL Y-27907]EGW31884.1 hypothetical protein SPAPADRAFT_62490 [Spathaspora passalidarum NRRL Y-27907]
MATTSRLTSEQIETALAGVLDIKDAISSISTQLDVLTDESTLKLEALLTKCPTDISDELQRHLKVDKTYKRSEEYYHYLRLLRVSKYHTDLQLIYTLSLHSNPNVPWCNNINSQIVTSIITEINMPNEIIEDFIENEYKRNIQQVKSERSSSGLRPRLGFNSVASEISSSEQIEKLKAYPISLSQAWFLIEISTDKHRWCSQVFNLTISFILNLLDLSDIEIKTHACQLLQFLLSKSSHFKFNSGLIKEVSKSLSKCLVYIPPSVSVDRSLPILSQAYPCLIEVYSTYGTNLDYVELISTIISNVNHLLTSEVEITEPVLVLLLDQVLVMSEKLDTDITICLSKLLYTLNQVIVNINICERVPQVIAKALNCQSRIITIFQSSTSEFKQILYSYRFDLLGAYGILYKRIKHFKDEAQLIDCMTENITQFGELSQDIDTYTEWQDLTKLVIPIY